MGGEAAFVFSPLSIPFLIMAASLLAVMMLVVMTRGSRVIRAALVALSLTALPYPVCLALIASCHDAEIARTLATIFVGSVALIGPALMTLVLAISGRLERYRWLVAFAFVTTAASCALTISSDLVILDTMWVTPSGMMFHRAGQLDSPHVAQFVAWAVIGVWLSRRGGSGANTARQRLHTKWIVLILVLAVTGAGDALLSHGIGFYPLGWVPATAAVWILIYAILRHDLIHSRGFDRASAVELGVIVGLAGVLFGALWIISTPVIAALTLTPIFAVGQLLILHVHRRPGVAAIDVGRVDAALEAFAEHAGGVKEPRALVEELTTLLDQCVGLTGVRLYTVSDEGAFVSVERDHTAPHSLQVDKRLRPWLISNRSVLVREDLATMRLGGLRDPIEHFMAQADVEIAIPLVDRQKLVGIVASDSPGGGRALRETELAALGVVAKATAGAVTYLGLLREAEVRVEVAKEMEVAAAVQHARSAGEQKHEYDRCDVHGFYQPASQFGGHWWSSHELPDGRLLVVVGDVTGYGVSAALVSFTIEGACETAQKMFGANLDVISLLELLNSSVLDVGGDNFAMSCFAAVFDFDQPSVTFANAGYPFPYVCREPLVSNGKGAELRALVSRGTPLGTKELVLSVSSLALRPDDVVVFYSDSLVESRDPEGSVYGSRRFQQLLRGRVRDAGANAGRLIIDEAMAHYAGRELDDDLNLVVVRLG